MLLQVLWNNASVARRAVELALSAQSSGLRDLLKMLGQLTDSLYFCVDFVETQSLATASPPHHSHSRQRETMACNRPSPLSRDLLFPRRIFEPSLRHPVGLPITKLSILQWPSTSYDQPNI